MNYTTPVLDLSQASCWHKLLWVKQCWFTPAELLAKDLIAWCATVQWLHASPGEDESEAATVESNKDWGQGKRMHQSLRYQFRRPKSSTLFRHTTPVSMDKSFDLSHPLSSPPTHFSRLTPNPEMWPWCHSRNISCDCTGVYWRQRSQEQLPGQPHSSDFTTVVLGWCMWAQVGTLSVLERCPSTRVPGAQCGRALVPCET